MDRRWGGQALNLDHIARASAWAGAISQLRRTPRGRAR